MKRKVIQILTDKNGALYALCDDGTIWIYNYRQQWEQLNEVPGT